MQRYASEYYLDDRLANGGYSLSIPTDSLLLWLQASSLAGTHNDGDTISSWTDSSGNGNTGTAVGTPVFKTGIVNGESVVRFDGTSAYFTFSSFLAGIEFEMFAVLATVNDPAASAGTSGAWILGSDNSNNHYPYTDGNVYVGAFRTSRPNTGNPTPLLSNWHVLDIWSAFNDYAVYINNASHYTSSSNTVGVTSSPMLGRSWQSTIYYYGDMAEVIIYNTKLSAAGRSQVIDYLSTRYGITVS